MTAKRSPKTCASDGDHVLIGGLRESYAYNAIGNLLSKTGVGAYTYGPQAGDCPEGPLTKAHAVVTAGNQAYCYDHNGNLRRRQMGGTTDTLTYDAENRLMGIGGGLTASFTYDGDGMRVKRNNPNGAIVYVGQHYEKNTSTGVVTQYYYLGGRRVAMRQGGTVHFLLGDHLGSSSVSYRSDGGDTRIQRYYPWGTIRPGPGNALPTDYTFTGQKLDESTGLMYYGARYYDPLLGRFISPDPIVPEPGNPQDLNRYSYVRNNPLRYIDPSGHRPCGAACPDDWIDWHRQFGAAYYGEWDVAKQQARRETAAKVLGSVFALVPEPDAGDDVLTLLTGCGYACQLGGEEPVGWRWRAVSGAALFWPISGSVLRHGDELLKAVGAPIRSEQGFRFLQQTFSPRFSHRGTFMGQTVESVVEGLRAGTITPEQIPVKIISRGGETYIVNTRSFAAVTQAGKTPVFENVTGDPFWEEWLTRRLGQTGGQSFEFVVPR